MLNGRELLTTKPAIEPKEGRELGDFKLLPERENRRQNQGIEEVLDLAEWERGQFHLHHSFPCKRTN